MRLKSWLTFSKRGSRNVFEWVCGIFLLTNTLTKTQEYITKTYLSLHNTFKHSSKVISGSRLLHYSQKWEQNLISLVILFNLGNCSRNFAHGSDGKIYFFGKFVRPKSVCDDWLENVFLALSWYLRRFVLSLPFSREFRMQSDNLFPFNETIWGNKYTGHDDGFVATNGTLADNITKTRNFLKLLSTAHFYYGLAVQKKPFSRDWVEKFLAHSLSLRGNQKHLFFFLRKKQHKNPYDRQKN